MGIARNACLCIFVVLAIVMVGGCICGLSSPGQPTASGSEQQSDSSKVETATVVATPTPMVSASPTATHRPVAFTVYVDGGKDHRPGETLHISGMDTYSDVVFLFVSCTMAPVAGGKLESPGTSVTDGDAVSFTRVNVSEDGSWQYDWKLPSDRPRLLFDLYSIIAAADPRDKPHLDEALAWDMVTVKISE